MINPASESAARRMRSGPEATWARSYGKDIRPEANWPIRLRTGLEEVPHRFAFDRDAALRFRQDA
jgi:hypothetical protein